MSLHIQSDVVIVKLCHFRYKVMLSLSCYVNSDSVLANFLSNSLSFAIKYKTTSVYTNRGESTPFKRQPYQYSCTNEKVLGIS